MKFKDLLHLNKEAAFPNRERVRKRVLNRRAKTTGAVIGFASAAAAVVLIAVIAVLAATRGIVAPEQVITGSLNVISSVEAAESSSLGMPVGSSLKITTTEDISAAELKARVAVTPEADYAVRKTGACSYELNFKENLKEDTLYNVEAVYNGTVVYRWAFQTETVFKLVGVMPGDQDSVDTDSAIEVTFSHADVTGFEQAFSISPAVEGTFRHYGRCWAFVPSEPMKEATLYTYTIAADVGGPNGARLDRDYSYSFTTAHKSSYATLIYRDNEVADTYLVNETPVAAVWYQNIDISKAHVDVYRLKDSAAFIEAHKAYVRSGRVSPEIMALAGERQSGFDTVPVPVKNFNGIYSTAAFINYPEPLPLGYYYAELTIGGMKQYQLIESTDLSVYTISTNGDYSVWVNNALTGEAVSGAAVTLDGFSERKTGSTGVATFSGSQDEVRTRFLTVANGSNPYVVALNGEKTDREIKTGNSYFTYITTNSALYRSSDKVGVFGVILPRRSGVKIPGEVTLECYLQDQEPITAKVNADGTFTAELELKNCAESGGGVRLMLDGNCLDSVYFDIADYELPVYDISLSTDRAAYRTGDQVSAIATVTYMDGTPAVGVEVEGDISGVTDENGRISTTFTAEGYHYESEYRDTRYPDVHSVSCHVGNGEFALYGNRDYLVFHGDYYLNPTFENGVLTVEARQIDFSAAARLEQDTLYRYSRDETAFTAGPASLPLHGALYRVTYTKQQGDPTYDAINKKTVYTTTYIRNVEQVRTFELEVQNGTASMPITETGGSEEWYYVVLNTYTDDVAATLYLNEDFYDRYGRQTYSVAADRDLYNIGDSVQLRLVSGADGETVNGGYMLYTVVSGEIMDQFISSSLRTTVEFKKDYAPYVLVYGAYFDGKHIYSAGYTSITYDTAYAGLTVSMEADRAQYRPGDEVNLTFRAADANGNPVSAALYVSVLDRALYLLNNNAYDPVYELYSGTPYISTVYTTMSYRDFAPMDMGGGEGGGEGGPTRSNFEDTPYYGLIRTGSDGKGTLKFVLPDSLTTWKIVAKGVTAQGQTGIGVFDLLSTQDYFVHATMASEVKTTDDFTVGVKCDGRGLAAGAESALTARLTDQNGNDLKTLTAQSKKSAFVYLNFGNLDAGVYTLYVKGESGALSDQIALPLTVTKTQAGVWVHNLEQVADGLSLSLHPQKGGVTVTITDENRALWQKAMARLMSSSGRRADQVLGQYLAARFYETGEWMGAETIDRSLLNSYTRYGGVSLFGEEGSQEEDLVTTAKFCAAAPGFVSKAEMSSYLNMYVNNRYAARVDTLIAYFGLAALGEPVLNDLNVIYRSASDFTTEEYAYLALGYAYAGDFNTARTIYEQKLKGTLVEADGRCHAEIEGQIDEALTGNLSLLSNRLSLECSEKLIAFIAEHDSSYTLLHLELISYLNDHVTELTGKNTVTVSTGDGRNETYSYQRTESLVLTLTAAQASNLRIANGEGRSTVSYAYTGLIEELEKLGGGTVISTVDYDKTVAVGEYTSISFTVEVPADYTLPMLTVTLPAGLRLERANAQHGDSLNTAEPEYGRNTVTLALHNGKNDVWIEARGRLPGSYAVEPILITNAENNAFIAVDTIRFSVK